MNQILKVKQWKTAQWTLVNPRLIHLHKCNRYVTIGVQYELIYPINGLYKPMISFLQPRSSEDRINIRTQIYLIRDGIDAGGGEYMMEADRIYFHDGKYGAE